MEKSPYRKAGGVLLPPDHYLADIDYVPVPPRSELNKIFDRVKSDRFDGHRWELGPSCKKITQTAGRKIFWLAHPDPEWIPGEGEDILAWADRKRSEVAQKGYRPATHQELIEFASIYPDLQRQFWVVALGSYTLWGDSLYVALLHGNSRERYLDALWFHHRWPLDCRFLFVPK